MKRGRLIVFEGIDGSGKSTQARRLFDRLRLQLGVILTVEPTHATTIGELLRRALAGHAGRDWTPETWASLFVADRVAHVANTITPALDAGITVVCDRYALSTLVYRHWVRGASRERIAATMQPGSGYIVPDITVLLDVEVETALERIQARGGDSVYERHEDLKHARAGYGREYDLLSGSSGPLGPRYTVLPTPHGPCIVIGGEGTEDEVATRVWRAVQGEVHE